MDARGRQVSAAQMPCEPGFLCRLGRKGIKCVSTASEMPAAKRPPKQFSMASEAWETRFVRHASTLSALDIVHVSSVGRLWHPPSHLMAGNKGSKGSSSCIQWTLRLRVPAAVVGWRREALPRRELVPQHLHPTTMVGGRGSREGVREGEEGVVAEGCSGLQTQVASGLVGFPRPGFAVHDQGSQQACPGSGAASARALCAWFG